MALFVVDLFYIALFEPLLSADALVSRMRVFGISDCSLFMARF